MATNITKWGNSQGIRIPQVALKKAKLHVGDEVDVDAQESRIIITKIKVKPHVKLADRLKNVHENFEFSEFDWGEPEGREEW
jgi:antitoxin MazE